MSADPIDLPITRPQLTLRELDVCHALGRGLSNKQVAIDLGVSARTIEIYAAKIREKACIPSGRAAFGIWYARTYPEMVGLAAPPELSALETDAHTMLECIRGLMNGDPRARAIGRVLLERHAGELE